MFWKISFGLLKKTCKTKNIFNCPTKKLMNLLYVLENLLRELSCPLRATDAHKVGIQPLGFPKAGRQALR